MNPNRTKIEQYIAHRLWAAKIRQETVSSKQIIQEIQYFYFKRDKLCNSLNRKILKLIKKQRKRIDMKFYNLKKRRSEWAALLGVPEEVIDILVQYDFIRNKWDVKRLIPLFNALKAFLKSS